MQESPILETESDYLNKIKNELEELACKDKNGMVFKGYFYTDRAFLAQNRILLKETIGKGSYSKVKEAFDLNRMNKIAVKIIDCSKAPQDFQDKFLPRELDIWPRLNNDNIIKMFDYFIRDEKVYMILEYANGGDLLTYIQNLTSPMNELKAKSWIKQICNAVDYLHCQNIIHRDLKLENLLIDLSLSQIKICDFGFAKVVSSSGLDSNNEDDLSKTYCGSKAYASPGF
jgi:serine kinase